MGKRSSKTTKTVPISFTDACKVKINSKLAGMASPYTGGTKLKGKMQQIPGRDNS